MPEEPTSVAVAEPEARPPDAPTAATPESPRPATDPRIVGLEQRLNAVQAENQRLAAMEVKRYLDGLPPDKREREALRIERALVEADLQQKNAVVEDKARLAAVAIMAQQYGVPVQELAEIAVAVQDADVLDRIARERGELQRKLREAEQAARGAPPAATSMRPDAGGSGGSPAAALAELKKKYAGTGRIAEYLDEKARLGL